MRRADRLFRIIEILRAHDVITARGLGEQLEVSERTVYRDIQDLMASGVNIQGEAGSGYVLREFDLPPIMFDRDEIEALTFGARMVESWGDSELATSARRAMAKIEAVLPADRRHLIAGTPLLAPRGGAPVAVSFDIGVLRRAIRERRRVRFRYHDAQGAETERTVWPLGMVFWGQIWFLLTWCELREDFRTFRPDRITSPQLTEPYPQAPGRTLDDYIAARRRDCDEDRESRSRAS